MQWELFLLDFGYWMVKKTGAAKNISRIDR